jgi:exodeoxyribonuclease-5
MAITLSPEQLNAVNLTRKWYNEQNKQYFVIAGLAGTGKSSIVNYLPNELGLSHNNVAYTAYTGKASMVMRSKGCYGATTIHKLIYEPLILRKLKEKEEIDTHGSDNIIDNLDEIFELEPEYEESVSFSKKSQLDRNIELIIVDEASMIGKDIQSDLESYNLPILYVGDHGQLPPVRDTFSDVLYNPDVKLETIHRQAADNPILKAAIMARNGNIIPYGEMKHNGIGVTKISKSGILNDLLLWANQILCYTNKQREEVNNLVRSLLGFPFNKPVIGDRIICRKNNYTLGLINGQQGIITSIGSSKKRGFHYIMSFEDEEGQEFKDISVSPNGFHGRELVMFGDFMPFQYGYCITTHKSQGSEWSKVLIYDEYPFWKKDYRNWLYTAITRASKEVVIVK